MYSSLEKLDVALTFPGSDLAYFAQTDHRDPAAIGAEASLSVIFVIVRCLAARAAAEESGRPFRVIYQLDREAPAFLDFAVTAAGGTIARTTDASLGTAPDRAPQAAQLEALMTDACTHLAAEAWRRDRLEPTLVDLFAFERRHHYRSDRDADEVDYYTRLVTLGALAASVLTPRLTGARWVRASGVIPFALSGQLEGADYFHIDVFGKAERFLEHGNADAPSSLVGALLGESVGVDAPFAGLTPADLEARALAGTAEDREARATAEAFARAAADALRAWGLPIGTAVRWVTRAVRDSDLRPIGASVYARVGQGHRGFDGERQIVESTTPFWKALERAIERHDRFDGRREDWFSSVDFRSACALRLRVPDDDGPFSGRLIADLPDPFTPLLAVWGTGYVVEAMDEMGTTLLQVTPSA